MKFANSSLTYRKRFTTMTEQTNVQPPEDDFPVIRNIGRAMFSVEACIFLLLGLVAVVNWLVDVFA
jgi:hypothetical protein